MLVGYRASQLKVDCSQGVSADSYVENGVPLPEVKFSYEWKWKSLGECFFGDYGFRKGGGGRWRSKFMRRFGFCLCLFTYMDA